MKKILMMAMIICLLLAMGIVSYANSDEFKIEGNTLVEYTGSGGDVVIPDGITTIGKKAFFQKEDITSITLPSSVTRIERYAFYNVGYNLFSKGNTDFLGEGAELIINIPENVTYIGDAAFKWVNASNLKIPKEVTYIGEESFTETPITNITIPKGIKVIPKKAFFKCKELKSVTLYDGITKIGESAFDYCLNLETINFPDSLTNIEFSAFSNCSSLKKVTIPSNVKTIEGCTFRWCTSLSDVVLPEGLEIIEGAAFQGCRSLGEIIIPKSVKEVKFSSFAQPDNTLVVVLYEDSTPHKCILNEIKEHPKMEDRWKKIIKVISANVNYDTASNWAKSELEGAVIDGLTTTRLTSNFKQQITRGEFCEIIMRLYDKLGGKGVQNTDNPFKDTNNGAIIRAYNAGIVNGTSENTFSPKGKLTREQLCVMIVKALDKSGAKLDKSLGYQMKYLDEETVSSWAKDSVRVLNGYKIFNGTGNNLDPNGEVTKQQAIVLLKRSYDLFK